VRNEDFVSSDSVPTYSAVLWIRIDFNADPDLGCDLPKSLKFYS
jgi:hypothetical protein